MNCKPGDLAVVVGSLPLGRFLIGRTLEVLSRADDSDQGAAWYVRFQNSFPNPITGEVGSEGVAADVFLRPIRPQPDDAVDEMVQKLGKPEEVTA